MQPYHINFARAVTKCAGLALNVWDIAEHQCITTDAESVSRRILGTDSVHRREVPRMDDPGIPSTIADLVADLRSREQATTEWAIAQLSDLGTAAVPWLLAALKAERETQGRINLGKALAHLGMVAWEPLLAAARDTDDLDFGWSVAWALKEFQVGGTVDDFLA